MKENQLIDRYGRKLDYLRLSITDRCNFRCYYCMPEEGMKFSPSTSLLSFDELYYLSQIFCELGISKIRITGGEPFVRNGIHDFLINISKIEGLKEISITSNGSLFYKHIENLKQSGIRKINISLDSMDRERFYNITRRDEFNKVYNGIFKMLKEGFDIKLNCVVEEGKNVEDIIPFVELTKDYLLSVRFLEAMPFNGSNHFDMHDWKYKKIYQHINDHYIDIIKLEDESNATSSNYKIPGYKGSFGIIASFSRTFCGTCNRIRLSATGELRTCLYGPPVINLRDIIRDGASAKDIKTEILIAVSNRAKDGFSAEALNKQKHQSMSVLGG